ncbi:MAG: cytochrome c biogenesis protein CcdA [Bacteroidota bacterium]
MRYILGIIFLLGTFATPSFAQIYNPVKWSTDYKQVSDNEFDLIFKAKIDDGWTVYSQYLESDDGPVRTSFNFDEGTHFELVGKNKEEGDRKEGFDKLFEMNVIKFAKQVIFTQRVKVGDLSKPISGYYEYMTCDATKCLPPDQIDFSFELKAKADAGSSSGSVDKAVEKKAEQPAAPKADSKVAENKADQKASETTVNPTNQSPSKIAANDNEPAPSTEPANDQASNSGILDPVSWAFEVKKINDQEYDLIYKAKIDEGWYIYSQFLEGDDGPIRTQFYWNTEDTNVEYVGDTKEEGPKRVKEYDKNFEMELIKFKKAAIFTQRVKVKDASKPFKGDLEFMTCEATRCLPPAFVPFKANFADLSTAIGDAAEEEEEAIATIPSPAIKGDSPYPFSPEMVSQPMSQCGEVAATEEEGSSIWSIFILGFLGGLVALLTPCVFPMIPLTVSFFTKGSENKQKGLVNAGLYGLFILLVYLLLSAPFHLMDSVNPDILNDISTNVWLNLAFFVIFIFFAFSFFGYYELTLPSSWTNKASSAESTGGILGIFFMALTLALVSFSCTGPILGSLLAGALSSDGGAWQLTSGMGGFGLALALPFALFAAFPGWMNSLPRSGGWLNSVKVVLGFLELALALKFLSNADLVKHWGLLKIEPFLILWIIVFIGLGAYLFGLLKFPHDSPVKKLGIPRMALGVLSIAFAIYLASGFRYNEKTETFTSLTLLSGLAPPVGYSWIHPKECPNNLDCFKDFDSGWAHARETGKPIMIDFTGYACVNCRKMEEQVWPKKKIIDYLKDDYVLISLYVDDKLELPESEQVTVEKQTGGKRKLRTYGNKWAHFQTEFFKNNSQPYYVLLSPDGTLLNAPVGYTPDEDEYANFLECGIQSFNEQKERMLGSK